MDEALQKVKMDMTIPEPENRVLSLQDKYVDVSESSRFSELPEKKLKIAIGHILKLIRPTALRQRMANVIKWEKDGKEDTGSLMFDAFMVSLVTQATKMEEDHLAKTVSESELWAERSEDEVEQDKRTGNYKKRKKKRKKSDSTDLDSESKKKGKREPKRNVDSLPPRLNSKYKCRHSILSCPITPDQDKQKLQKVNRDSNKTEMEDGKKTPTVGALKN